MFKNRGVTAMIEQVVYKIVLQRAGWALPRPFLYIHLFFQNKKEVILLVLCCPPLLINIHCALTVIR
jgi:hypothetical protein